MSRFLSDKKRMGVWGTNPDEMRQVTRLGQFEEHNKKVSEAQLRPKSKPLLRCQFCGRESGQVAKIITGPPPATICNECVDVCSHLLKKNGA